MIQWEILILFCICCQQVKGQGVNDTGSHRTNFSPVGVPHSERIEQDQTKPNLLTEFLQMLLQVQLEIWSLSVLKFIKRCTIFFSVCFFGVKKIWGKCYIIQEELSTFKKLIYVLKKETFWIKWTCCWWSVTQASCSKSLKINISSPAVFLPVTHQYLYWELGSDGNKSLFIFIK